MEDSIKVLKALSDETRFKIVSFLMDGEKCVCEIIPYAKKDQSTVSIHLGKLEAAGVLESRKEGRKVLYRIKDDRIYDIFMALGVSGKKASKREFCAKGQKR